MEYYVSLAAAGMRNNGNNSLNQSMMIQSSTGNTQSNRNKNRSNRGGNNYGGNSVVALPNDALALTTVFPGGDEEVRQVLNVGKPLMVMVLRPKRKIGGSLTHSRIEKFEEIIVFP